MKSINQILIATAFIAITLLSAATSKAANGNKSTIIKGGSVHYTLHIGKKVITQQVALADDSYISDGTESNIVIADPNGKFHIGVVIAGPCTPGKVTQNKNESSYTLANYLTSNSQTHTMDAIPFENGFVNITQTSAGGWAVSFMYTLKDKNTGELITLKGMAQFDTVQLALQ